MALISCDECGHRISDKSIFCPNCGYPTHLNKALRERQPDAAEGSPTSTAVTPAATRLTETPAATVEAILNHQEETAETPQDTAISSESSVATEPAEAETPAETRDALAEYEATLSRPRTPQSNNRMKLVLYFTVLIVLLGAVFLCYYYAKSSHLGSINEVQCEPIDETLIEEVDEPAAAPFAPADSLPADSIAILSAALPDSGAGAPMPVPQPPVATSPSVKQL